MAVGYLSEIKHSLHMHASQDQGLNNCWIGWAKRKQTSRMDTPFHRVTSPTESALRPYSNLMSDVQSTSRCYRCLTDFRCLCRSCRCCNQCIGLCWCCTPCRRYDTETDHCIFV